MGRNKLKRFAINEQMPHVFEPPAQESLQGDHPMKGKWRSDFFKNDHPIVLEVGCGRGEYSVGMARKFPNKNFIGMDIKGARIFVGATQAQEEGLNNVAFIRTRVEFLENYFATEEVDEIWITFPDPQPKDRHARKRLTSTRFVALYRKILRKGGMMHLKTDSDVMYESTQFEINEHGYELIGDYGDLYQTHFNEVDKDTQDILGIKTHYERLFAEQGHVIKYIKFKIN